MRNFVTAMLHISRGPESESPEVGRRPGLDRQQEPPPGYKEVLWDWLGGGLERRWAGVDSEERPWDRAG